MNITMTYKGHKPKEGVDLQVTQYNYDQVKSSDSSWSLEHDLTFWDTFPEGVESKKNQQPKTTKLPTPKVQGTPLTGHNPQVGGIPKSARKLTKKTKKSPLPKTATTVLPSQVNRKRKSMI